MLLDKAVRCDEPMKRSKEKCLRRTETGMTYRWKCTGKCEECICCLIKQDDGTWLHVKKRK